MRPTKPPKPLSWDLRKANEHRLRLARLRRLRQEIRALTPLILHGRRLA